MKSNPSLAAQNREDLYNFFVKIKWFNGAESQKEIYWFAVWGYLNMMVMDYLMMVMDWTEENIETDLSLTSLQLKHWNIAL